MPSAGRAPASDRRAAWGALAGNVGLAAFKVAGGLWFGSQAILADGIHSCSDAAGSAAVLYALRVAAEPPDADHPYGHEKAEAIAALVVGLLLLIAGVWVAASAVSSLLRGAPAQPAIPALAVAVAALLAKLGLLRWAARVAGSTGSAALAAVAADHRSDLWSSLAALAGVGAALVGARWADPLMALFVSGVLVVSGAGVARVNINELLEGRAGPDLETIVREAAQGVDGVVELRGLRARTMGRHVLVDLKIGVDGDMSVRAGHAVARAVTRAVHAAAPSVREVLVHVNPSGSDEPAAPAGAASAGKRSPKALRREGLR